MALVEESREHYRLYAPARVALRVPGEPSLFGRGLWRLLRESQAGCMLLVFIAFGLAIYRQIQEIPPPGERLETLSVTFDVPPDLPGTRLDREEATYWQVAFEIPVVGPNVETVFLAPVYNR